MHGSVFQECWCIVKKLKICFFHFDFCLVFTKLDVNTSKRLEVLLFIVWNVLAFGGLTQLIRYRAISFLAILIRQSFTSTRDLEQLIYCQKAQISGTSMLCNSKIELITGAWQQRYYSLNINIQRINNRQCWNTKGLRKKKEIA